MRKQTVLVTGGAGFIGSYLSQALLNRGYQVRVLDNLSFGNKECIPGNADFIEGDICDIDACRHAMQGVTGVFHCAAMSRVGLSSIDNIDPYTRTNIQGTQNILITAHAAGVKKIIYSGSSTYYGNQPTPHREYETQGEFLNFYALTKYIGEKYCLMFDEAFDLPCIILRYFNVYGHKQPEVGAYALVLGIFLRRFANGETLQIHGEGHQRRDFIHISDIAAANIAAFESNLRHEIFNVGSGTNISIKELADIISPLQEYEDRRAGDADSTLAEMSRTRNILKWEPRISFENGIREMMAQYR